MAINALYTVENFYYLFIAVLLLLFHIPIQLETMEKSSILRFTFIFAIICFIFVRSVYPSSKSEFLASSPCFPRCTSKNRIHKFTDHRHTTPLHPLDPLTVQEINKVRAILSSYAPFASSFATIHSLSLDEPDKTQALAWSKGDPLPPRKAFAIVSLNAQSHMLTVDLNLGQVIHHTIHSGSGYPPLTMDDQSAALQVTLADADFQKSITERGVKLSDVTCVTLAAGWYGPDEENRRVIKVQCFSSEGTPNFYTRPIEGLTVTVDLDQKKIVKISNTGRGIPIAKRSDTDYRYTTQVKSPEMKPLKPISIEQPEGPSFVVEDGHMVKWANWVFHLKADQRAGMVISRAMVQDSESGELRSVMYKGFCSELFVPYMDPDEHWYFKTYLDGGEYGLGATSLSLVPLNDCPRHSYYMDGIFVAADGKPFVQPNVICLFESYSGDISWRHSNRQINGSEVTNSNFTLLGKLFINHNVTPNLIRPSFAQFNNLSLHFNLQTLF